MKNLHKKLALLLLCATGVWQSQSFAQGALTRERCEALQRTSISPAQIGEPVSAVQIISAKWDDSTTVVHCRIDGRLAPVDRSANARDINFGVALPAMWNNRAIQMGGGGLNGTVPGLGGRSDRSELARGYVTYGSDSGHSVKDDPSWLLNDEAIRNLGFQQMKKTHDAAFVLIKAAYGSAPAYNYFVGGSQGGREGLTVAQRYPKDYNGVLSSVPVTGFSTLMLSPTLVRIQEKPLANWVPAERGPMLLAEFMRQCDGLDGSIDAVINNYVDCRAIFNVNDRKGPANPWSALRCRKGVAAGDCLSKAQIATLHLIFSDYRPGFALPNGLTRFGMSAPTTAIAAPGLEVNKMVPAEALLVARRYKGQEGAAADAPNFTRLGTDGVTGFLMQDPAGNSLDYNVARHGARHAQVAAWLDSSQSDLKAFAAGGSKVIVAIGTDDTVAPSGEQLNYYQSLLDTMGRKAVDAFARLYVLPQTGHGLTGKSAVVDGKGKAVEAQAIPSRADRFALLVNWVENGVAPAKTVEVSGDTGTRPMCSYPEYPHFKGGDATKAASYACRRPAYAVKD
ncbi:MAG: tannase/feruloyl esterase family alpha/beta hydrolase [Steroidobacteraceae bacterium]